MADSIGESGIVKDVLDGLNEDDISEKYGSNVEEKSDWLDGSMDLGDTSKVFIDILDDSGDIISQTYNFDDNKLADLSYNLENAFKLKNLADVGEDIVEELSNVGDNIAEDWKENLGELGRELSEEVKPEEAVTNMMDGSELNYFGEINKDVDGHNFLPALTMSSLFRSSQTDPSAHHDTRSNPGKQTMSPVAAMWALGVDAGLKRKK